MLMKISTVILFVIIAMSSSVRASSEIDEITIPLLDSIQSGKVENLFSLVFPVGSMGRKYFSSSDVEKYDSKFSATLKTLGKSYGYEQYYQSEIPGVFIIKYYIFRYESEPVLVKIRLYKPDSKWIISAFEVDASLDDYLENSAKTNMGNMAGPK